MDSILRIAKILAIAIGGLLIFSKVIAVIQTAIVIIKAVSAAMIVFNAIAAANPIVWIVVAVIALIAVIVLLVKNWHVVKQVFSNVFGYILGIIDQVKNSFRYIVDAFKDGGFVEGIKKIGQTILAFLLTPLIAVMKLLNKVGVGRGITEKLTNLQSGLLGDSDGEEMAPTGQPINPQAQAQRTNIERSETVRNDRMTISVEGKNSDVKVKEKPKFMPVVVNETGNL
jgi:hypothetical protein